LQNQKRELVVLVDSFISIKKERKEGRKKKRQVAKGSNTDPYQLATICIYMNIHACSSFSFASSMAGSLLSAPSNLPNLICVKIRTKRRKKIDQDE